MEVKSTPEKGSPPQGIWNGVGGMGWEGGLGGVEADINLWAQHPISSLP